MVEHRSNDVDALLELLADSRRRHALSCMLRHDELTLPDLAERVTELETGTAVENIPAEQVTEVYFSLYHTHVPKLEGNGLLEYDQERDLVSRDGDVETAIGRARDELATLDAR